MKMEDNLDEMKSRKKCEIMNGPSRLSDEGGMKGLRRKAMD